jgi:putative SOS response-associated peptidase YedK
LCYSAIVKASYETLGLEWNATVARALWSRIEGGGVKGWNPSDHDKLQTRIFPGSIAPVIAELKEGRLVVPMRYSVPANPGNTSKKSIAPYNMRIESLEKPFWQGCVGVNHGVIAVHSLFEWVKDSDDPKKKKSLIQLKLKNGSLAVPVVFRKGGFALMTTEAPEPLAAVGLKRSPILLDVPSCEEWLKAPAKDHSTGALLSILSQNIELSSEDFEVSSGK